MSPIYWQRDTSRYGLRRVPLCPACISALRGETYQRDRPAQPASCAAPPDRPATRALRKRCAQEARHGTIEP